jgi:hypothetical protein
MPNQPVLACDGEDEESGLFATDILEKQEEFVSDFSSENQSELSLTAWENVSERQVMLESGAIESEL